MEGSAGGKQGRGESGGESCGECGGESSGEGGGEGKSGGEVVGGEGEGEGEGGGEGGGACGGGGGGSGGGSNPNRRTALACSHQIAATTELRKLRVRFDGGPCLARLQMCGPLGGEHSACQTTSHDRRAQCSTAPRRSSRHRASFQSSLSP